MIIRLAVECKNLNDKQWVLFSMEDTEVPFDEFTISNLQTLTREEKKAKFNKIKTNLIVNFLRQSHYEKDDISHAFSHYVPFGKKDSFHDALQKSIGAVKYSLDEIQVTINKFNLDIFRNLYVFYPIIVCNKNLFEYKVDSDKLIETDHIMYVTKGLGESYTSYAFDVVTINGFKKLLKYIEQELNPIP